MTTTLKKVEITTGVECGIYEYVWKILNFGLVQETPGRLSQQKFEMELGRPGSGVHSKWLVGLKPASTVQMYFKLLEITGCELENTIRIFVINLRRDDLELLLQTEESTIGPNVEIVLNLGWKSRQTAADWYCSPATDVNGTMNFKLRVEFVTKIVLKTAPPLRTKEVTEERTTKRHHCIIT